MHEWAATAPWDCFLVWQHCTKHWSLLFQSFVLAKRWGRVIQPPCQVGCWRRTTSQKFSTTWGLCLWGIAEMIFKQQLKAVFFQSNLMTSYMNWHLQKQLPTWPVDGEEPWWLCPSIWDTRDQRQRDSAASLPQRRDDRDTPLCALHLILLVPEARFFLLILPAEEVIKFHCGVSCVPNVYGQDWKIVSSLLLDITFLAEFLNPYVKFALIFMFDCSYFSYQSFSKIKSFKSLFLKIN